MRGEKQSTEGAAEQRREVEREESDPADRRLQQRPEEVQDVHVEADVEDPERQVIVVQERAGEDAPVLALKVDRRAEEGAGLVDPAASHLPGGRPPPRRSSPPR